MVPRPRVIILFTIPLMWSSGCSLDSGSSQSMCRYAPGLSMLLLRRRARMSQPKEKHLDRESPSCILDYLAYMKYFY